MTGQYTDPPISVAQNEPEASTLLAAQARLYSDAKRDAALRVVGMAVLGLALSVLSMLQSGRTAVGTIGGVLLLLANAALMYRERRCTATALSVQETFDCSVFQLPWNDLSVRRRPSGQEIARAAERYEGDRIHNWYPDTGSAQRPFDIVICQQSNVGWGAPVHRAWAWTLVGLSMAWAIFIAAFWTAIGLSALRGMDALVLPFLPLVWEAFEVSRSSFESARDKEEVQTKMLSDWASGLDGSVPLTEARCRGYQDEIAAVRRRNARVPDWFDHRLRHRNERAMRTTAVQMLAEAHRFGRA